MSLMPTVFAGWPGVLACATGAVPGIVYFATLCFGFSRNYTENLPQPCGYK